uniref:hypothetical protein n=1 Tax=Methylogaea oryzae TaxID=1295382 RepID=UPI001C3F3A08
RSAGRMDGAHNIELEDFLRICRRLGPSRLPFSILPDEPAIHLVFFVHRVKGWRRACTSCPVPRKAWPC